MTERGGILFEDSFDVEEVNPKGKSSQQFNNVARIFAKGVTFEMDLVIDIQCQLFPIRSKERFQLALASTLDMEGKADNATFNQSGEPTLLDKFDYGMHGKVFRYEFEGEHRIAVYVSYGGLLMKIVGDQRALSALELDSMVYCLIKRTEKD